MGEVYVYEPNADDFDCMGLCGALRPISCVHTEEANGMSEIEMVHPIDENGRWSFLQDGFILKADVPVRTTPEIQHGALVTSVEKWQVRSGATKGQRYLFTKESGGKKKKLLPVGLTLTVVKKGTTRHKVKTKKHGSGWVYVSAIQYTLTEIIPNDPAAIEQVEPAWTVRSQLFRIYDHEVRDDGVTVHARHIFYDLIGNLTTYDGSDARFQHNPTAVEAGEGILDGCITGHDFEFFSNLLDTRAGARWVRQNPVSALLDPEEGLCAQWGAEIVRDDWEITVLKEAGFNRGVRIEYAKNLLGVRCEIDTSDVITRIVPVGQTAKGGALLLPSPTRWVDSPKINDYPVPHIFVLDVGSSVKAKSTKSADVTAAQNKLREKAQKKFADDECDVPAITLKVDFIALGQTEEYRQYEQLEALFLYDRVRVRHPDILIDTLCEVKRMEFDCLTGRPKKIELGKVKLLSQLQPIAKWQLPNGINAQSKLLAGSVTDAHLAEGSVNDTHLTDESVLENHILDGSVSPAKLKVGFFEADVIQAALATIVVANITTANIQNANIDWAAIANLSAEIAIIASAQITSAKIAEANIDWANIESLNATIATIASAQINSAKIAEANIDWASIASLTAQVAEIARAQITTANIEHAGIDWAAITNLSAQIASMVNAQILSAVIDTAQIRDGSIVSAKIADAAITTAKIQAASITSAQIALGAITTALIDTGAVGTAQIMDGSITDAKIVELTANKINAGTLSVERLIITGSDHSIVYEINCASGTPQLSQTTIDGGALTQRSITADRIVAQAITADELAAACIIANKIAAGAVEADKLAANAVTAGKIAAGAITVDKLASGIGNALDISSNEAILSRVSQMQYDGERVYTQDEPPASPVINTKWLDTSGDSPVLKMYDGSEWITVGEGADTSALLDELEKLSTSITQTSEQITQMVSKTDMTRYLSFSAQNGVQIGDTASSYKVQILSDRVNILQNGAIIAYFASSKLYITEGELTSSLTIGNYTLKKTTDGGIAIG